MTHRLGATFAFASAGLLAYELLLTRVFAVVLFADLAHVALSLAMLGLAFGALACQRWPGLVPADGVERAVSRWTLAQAVTTVLAVVALVNLPLVPEDTHRVATWFDRAEHRFELVRWGLYAALIPVLALPSVCAGIAFAGATARLPARANALYGWDLVGGAAGALLFLPALLWAQGPDAVTVPAALALAAAAASGGAWTRGLAGIGAIGVAVAGGADLLPVRTSVAWSEANVVEARWTPLARIALHRLAGEDTILLDNTSASVVVNSEATLAHELQNPGRSLVHRLSDPGGHVAVLAAAAGPEVVMARRFGHVDVDAIDITGDVFAFAERAYPPGVDNPYADPRTRRLALDARAAVTRSAHPYDTIQLLNANLLSAAGLLANAWTPGLLETREAFRTWFAHLTPDGVLSMAVNLNTAHDLPAAVAALTDRRVEDPWSCLRFEPRVNLLLARPRPWTPAEATRLSEIAATYPGRPPLHFETGARLQAWARDHGATEVLTDDHPFPDTLPAVWAALRAPKESPVAMLYRTLLAQGAILLAIGAVVLGLPLVGARRSGLTDRGRLPAAVLFFGSLGYGYLSLETGAIHGVVLFVGHPAYAVTTVVATMMCASGLGSLWAGRMDDATVRRRLPGLLLAAVFLGAFQAWATPTLLGAATGALPTPARIAVVSATLTPLAFVLGTPFSSVLRLVGPPTPALVGWAWALNGWMSVVGGLVTVLIARTEGYAAATGTGVLAYVLATACVARVLRTDPGR